MSSRFATLMQSASVAIDRRLSDCYVTVGNTVGLASSLRPPLSAEAVYDDSQNIKLRGLFESPFLVDINREGYEITVGMETPVPLLNTQNVPMLRRGDRLFIEHDADDRDAIQLVYGITSVQPDGKWRVLLRLALLGPMCDSDVEYVGFPLVFPFVFGHRTFDSCVTLNGGPDFVNVTIKKDPNEEYAGYPFTLPSVFGVDTAGIVPLVDPSAEVVARETNKEFIE